MASDQPLDLNRARDFLDNVRAGRKPSIADEAPESTLIYEMLVRMRAGHFLSEQPWIYVTQKDDTEETLRLKGNTAVESYPHASRRSRKFFKYNEAAAGLKNYSVLGRWDDFDVNEAGSYILVPDGTRALTSFLTNVLPKLQDGTWPETKPIVIVNKDEFQDLPWEHGGFYDPIIKAFNLTQYPSIKICHTNTEAAQYLHNTLGPLARQASVTKDMRVDLSQAGINLAMATHNKKKPKEGSEALENMDSTAKVYPWLTLIDVLRKAPEKSLTASGNNREKMDYALANLLWLGLKGFKEEISQGYEKDAFKKAYPDLEKMIVEIDNNGMPEGGIAELSQTLNDSGVYTEILSQIRLHLNHAGGDFDKDAMLFDDRSLEVFVTDGQGNIDLDMSMKLFNETQAFRELRELGVLNPIKPGPGAELANVLKKYTLERFYGMIKEASQELVDKYGQEKGWSSVEDMHLEADDIHSYIAAKLYQEDYANPVYEATHSVRRNKLYFDPLPLERLPEVIKDKRSVRTSEHWQGPTGRELNSRQKFKVGIEDPRHVEDLGFFIYGGPPARALRAMADRTGLDTHLSQQGKREFNLVTGADKYRIAVFTPQQKEALEEKFGAHAKSIEFISIFDAEFGLEWAFRKNDKPMMQTVFQNFLNQADGFISPPDMGEDKTPVIGKDEDFFIKSLLFKMVQVGQQTFDGRLVYGKPFCVCPNSDFNQIMLDEHKEGYRMGGVGDTPGDTMDIMPLDNTLVDGEVHVGAIEHMMLKLQNYTRKHFEETPPAIKSNNLRRARQPNYHQYTVTGYASASDDSEVPRNSTRKMFHALSLLKFPKQTGGGAEGHMCNMNDGHHRGLDQIEAQKLYRKEEIENITLHQIQCYGTRNSEGPHYYTKLDDTGVQQIVRQNNFEIMHDTIHGRKEQLGMTRGFLLAEGYKHPEEVKNAEVAFFGGLGTLEEIDASIVNRLAEANKRSDFYAYRPLILVNDQIEGEGFYQYRVDKLISPELQKKCNIEIADNWMDALKIVIEQRREAGLEPGNVVYESLLDMPDLTNEEKESLWKIATDGVSYQAALNTRIQSVAMNYKFC